MVRKLWLLSAAVLLLLPAPTFAQSKAWQIDIRGADNLYTHSLADPASDLTLIGAVSDPNAIGPDAYDVIAMDADSSGTLFGVELGLLFPNVLTLGTIDGSTGSFTAVATLVGGPTFANGVSAMTIDAGTDIGYISDGVSLWTIDLTTAQCNLVSAAIMDVGTATALTQVWELAADGAGNFWAFDVLTDSLYSMDETNGNCTLIGVYTGPGGRDGNPTFSNNGMDWDPVSGQLIGDVYTGGGTGTLGIWNTTTGAFTTILEHDDYPLADPRVGGPIACFGGTTYQFNFYLSEFLTYSTLDPAAGVNRVAAPFVVALDFNESGDTLYAVDSANLTLGTLNQSTGAYEPMMPLTGDFTIDADNPFAESMSFDPSTGTFYLSNRTTLYTLDVTTGNTVFVADYMGPPLSTDPPIVAIAANSAGDLFAFSIGETTSNGSTLWSVNIANGQLTALGTYTNAAPFADFQMDMDFDPADDTLYASIYTGGGTGDFGTWNTSTGVFTSIIDLTLLPPDADMDGYEMILAVKPESTEPVVITGESLMVSPGLISSGGLPELEVGGSDNQSLVLFRDPTSINAVTQFVLTSTSPTTTPTTFDFVLEGRCISRPNVVQRVELFDYSTGSYEVVDERNAVRMPPDLAITVSPTGDLSRFVDPSTNEIQARVRYRADSPRAQFSSRTDQAVWMIQ